MPWRSTYVEMTNYDDNTCLNILIGERNFHFFIIFYNLMDMSNIF